MQRRQRGSSASSSSSLFFFFFCASGAAIGLGVGALGVSASGATSCAGRGGRVVTAMLPPGHARSGARALAPSLFFFCWAHGLLALFGGSVRVRGSGAHRAPHARHAHGRGQDTRGSVFDEVRVSVQAHTERHTCGQTARWDGAGLRMDARGGVHGGFSTRRWRRGDGSSALPDAVRGLLLGRPPD